MAQLIQPFGSAALKNTANALVTTDQSVTSSTTLTNATGMSFSIAANETWYFDFTIGVTCSVAGQSQFAITSPSGASGSNIASANGTGTGCVAGAAFGSAMTITGTLTAVMVHITGYVTASSTPGTVQLQFAQATSDGTATKVKTGSFFQAWRTA